MKPALAHKRYRQRIMGSALGYLGAVFGVSFLHDSFTDGSIFALLISAIPAAFIIVMLWAVWRFLGDMDEVAHHDNIHAMIEALLIILAFTGGWGLIELFNDDFPRLPIFFVFPGFFIIYGLIAGFKYKRCV